MDITNAEFRDSLLLDLPTKIVAELAEPFTKNTEAIEQILKDNFKVPVDAINKNILEILNVLKQSSVKAEAQHKESRKALEELATGGGGGGAGGAGGAGAAGAAGGAAGNSWSANFAKGMKSGGILSGINSLLSDVTKNFKPLNFLWSEMIGAEVDYQTQMRMIAFETQGVTGDMRNLQKEFLAIGETAKLTGQGTTRVQENFVKNIQKGVRTTRKELLDVTKTQMTLSTLIGDKENALAEDFRHWHVALGMTNVQIGEVSRGIQATAKNSGLTGAALIGVVQSSKQFVEQMRNAGTLSASAVKNVVELLAQAEKLGVKAGMSKILAAASDGYKLLYETDVKTQTFLYKMAGMAGKTAELTQGIWLKNAKGNREMANSMSKHLKELTGGKSIEEIKNLDPERMNQLNILAQNAYGMGIMEYVALLESTTKAGRSFKMKLEDIDTQLKNGVITEESRLKLIKEQNELMTSESLDFLGKISAETIAGTTDLLEASKKALGSIGEEGQESLSQLAKYADYKVIGGVISEMDALNISAQAAAKGLKQAGSKEDWTGQAKKLNVKDPKAFNEFIEKMKKEDEKLRIAAKANSDPITALALKSLEVEESIRNYVRLFIPAISAGIAALVVLASIAQGAMLIKTLVSGFGNLKNGMAIFGGRFGTAVSGLGTKFGTAVSGLGTKLSGLFGGFGTKVTGLVGGIGSKLGFGAKAASATAKVAAGTQMMLPGMEVAAKGGGVLSKLGVGLKGFGGVLGKLAWPIAIATTAIGGVTQAAESSAKANEIFKVDLDKVTVSQRRAAEGAGFLTGMLNSLTFGIFDGVLGATGDLTVWLAELFDKCWPLNLALQALMVPFKFLWEVLKGLWGFLEEVFIGIWDGIKIAMEPIGALWNEVVLALKPLLDMLTPLGEALGLTGDAFKDIDGVMSLISPGIKRVGTLVGDAFRLLGGFVKKLIIEATPIIVWLVKTFVEFITDWLIPAFNLMVKFWSGVWKIMQGVWSIIKAIMTFDFSEVNWDILWEGIKDCFTSMGTLLWATFVAFPEWLKDKFLEGLGLVGEALKNLANWVLDQLPGGDARKRSREIEEKNKEMQKMNDVANKRQRDEWASLSPEDRKLQYDLAQSKLRGAESSLKNAEKQQFSAANPLNHAPTLGNLWLGTNAIEDQQKIIASSQKQLQDQKEQLKNMASWNEGLPMALTEKAKAKVDEGVAPQARWTEEEKALEAKASETSIEANKAMTQGNSIYVHDVHVEKLLSNYLMNGLDKTNLKKNDGSIFSGDLSPTLDTITDMLLPGKMLFKLAENMGVPEKGTATTSPSVDTLERVQQEQASITAGTKGDQTASMGKLENLNSDQVTLLQNISAGINALVASIKSNNTIGQKQYGSNYYEEEVTSLGMTESSNWSAGLESGSSKNIPVRNY